MRHRPFGNTGLLVSEIALGTVELGADYGFRGSSNYSKPRVDEAYRILHQAVDAGINLFDTAPAYGDAETVIGKVLPELHPRPLIATKFTGDVRASVENSLRNLGVDCIDLLQLHQWTKDEAVLSELDALQDEGKIRFAGASVYSESSAMQALGLLPMRALQLPFNFLDQRLASRVLPLAQQRRVGVLIRSAFLRGVLTDRVSDTPAELQALRDAALNAMDALQMPVAKLAEVALRFCLSTPGVSTVLVGVRSEEELRQNVAAAEMGALEESALRVLRTFAMDDEQLLTPTNWAGLI